MEKVLNNGFCEMNQMEMEGINGGGAGDAWCVGLGAVAVAWAAPVAFICPPAAIAMATIGSAAILVGCDVDVELIKY